MDTVEKRISFYKLILNRDGNNVDPLKTFSIIDSLPFTENERYLPVADGNLHLMHIFNGNIPLKISLGTSRRKNLPSIEEEGITSPLEIYNAGLFEPTHAMIFPNNIIGIESNYYGPKPSSFERYISKKASSIVDNVEIIPLMRSDFLEYISQIGDIKVLEFKVHRNMTEHFKGITKSLNHILNGMKDSTSAEYIGITLNSSKKRGMLLKWRDEFLKRFQNQENRDAASKAIIKATDITSNKIREFNLLEQYFISTKEVLKSDDIHRNVSKDSMFEAINESYLELKDEIAGITEMPKKKTQTKLDSFN